MQNSSSDIVFFLGGLNDSRINKQIYFAFSVLTYLSTVLANLTLIVTVFLDKILHEPMYIFLCSLCVNGIYGATAFYPKILVDLLSDAQIISYSGCLTQLFIVYSYGLCELATLTVMAYDRYVAICKPLQYHSIMTPGKVRTLVAITWLLSFLEIFIMVILIIRLPLCGFTIDNLYCTDWEVVKLSCSNITPNTSYTYVLALIHISQTLLIIISYLHIIRSCVRSKAEQSKFMETCLPHLVSLINFIVSGAFDALYAQFSSDTVPQAVRNMLSIEYLVVPPLLNPLIYGLKLKLIRTSLRKQLNRKLSPLK